eukprot:6182050-Pleurochrysis_carterae.AAC.1
MACGLAVDTLTSAAALVDVSIHAYGRRAVEHERAVRNSPCVCSSPRGELGCVMRRSGWRDSSCALHLDYSHRTPRYRFIGSRPALPFCTARW